MILHRDHTVYGVVMNRTHASVVVAGSASIDTIVMKGRRRRQLGGVVTYGGITFRRHGHATTVVTNVAVQDRTVLRALAEEGIHTATGRSPATTRFVNFVDGCQRRQTMPAAARPITAGQLVPLVETAAHVHIGALHPDDIDAAALAALAPADVSISVDLQGYARARRGRHIVAGASPLLPRLLALADYVKADRAELEVVVRACGYALPKLMEAFALREVIVTEGDRGGYVAVRGGRKIRYRARPVHRIMHTVGAGDVFFATYLIHRLHRREDIALSLRRAADLVALQIEGRYIRPETLRLGDMPGTIQNKGASGRP